MWVNVDSTLAFSSGADENGGRLKKHPIVTNPHATGRRTLPEQTGRIHNPTDAGKNPITLEMKKEDKIMELAGTVDGIRYEIGEIKYLDGSVERIALSLETCRCGHSFAREGVGYLNSIVKAWVSQAMWRCPYAVPCW